MYGGTQFGSAPYGGLNASGSSDPFPPPSGGGAAALMLMHVASFLVACWLLG
jgi:hypothetical protein